MDSTADPYIELNWVVCVLISLRGVHVDRCNKYTGMVVPVLAGSNAAGVEGRTYKNKHQFYVPLVLAIGKTPFK